MQYSIILISKRFFSVLRKALKSYTIFERPIRYGSVNLAKPEDFRMALPYLQIEGQSLKISVWLGRTCDRGHSLRPSAGAQSSKFRHQLLVS